MGKEVVFDYSKATGFISAEEMANFKKTVMTAKETLLSKEGVGSIFQLIMIRMSLQELKRQQQRSRAIPMFCW